MKRIQYMDKLVPEALRLCLMADTVSVSLIQRKLQIGYPRAARIVDQMVMMDAITQEEPRKVKVTYEEIDKEFGVPITRYAASKKSNLIYLNISQEDLDVFENLNVEEVNFVDQKEEPLEGEKRIEAEKFVERCIIDGIDIQDNIACINELFEIKRRRLRYVAFDLAEIEKLESLGLEGKGPSLVCFQFNDDFDWEKIGDVIKSSTSPEETIIILRTVDKGDPQLVTVLY